MKKTVLIYGLMLAILVFCMKFLEYKYFLRDLSVEFYVGVVAIFFTALGIWMGLKFTNKSGKTAAIQPGSVKPEQFEISKREFEVLQLISQELSNQEIADKLFVSLNTVKTHTSNLFSKLDAKRRTQALQRAKDLGLLA